MPATWEEKFGKPANEMDEGERWVAISSVLYGIEQRLDEMNGKVKLISRHDKMIWAGTGIIPILFGWLCYISKRLFGIG